MTAITIRDVPDDVRQGLAAEASEAGQSLQAYLLGVLTDRARFANRNRELLREAEQWFAEHPGEGVGDDGPRAADVIRQARREAGRE
jgi:hypothetical protein